MKIKIYCDTGADIICLKPFYDFCEFYQFPYDSHHRHKRFIRQGIMKLALASAAQWRDSNETWE